MIYAVISMIANMALSPLLVWPLGIGYLGIPIATSVAAWINTGLLVWFLVQRGHLTLDSRLVTRLPRFALAALVMAGLLWPAADALWPWLSGAVWQRVLAMLAVVIGGAAVYAACCLLLRAASVGEIRGMLRRSGSK